MVDSTEASVFCAGAPLAQLMERLPPVVKAKVLLALLGLIVLGLGMTLLIVLGGRYVRRLSHSSSAPTKPIDDSWHRKPLSPPVDSRDDAPQ